MEWFMDYFGLDYVQTLGFILLFIATVLMGRHVWRIHRRNTKRYGKGWWKTNYDDDL
jgi:high-affinity Fe2+/Pb2+ permease